MFATTLTRWSLGTCVAEERGGIEGVVVLSSHRPLLVKLRPEWHVAGRSVGPPLMCRRLEAGVDIGRKEVVAGGVETGDRHLGTWGAKSRCHVAVLSVVVRANLQLHK